MQRVLLVLWLLAGCAQSIFPEEARQVRVINAGAVASMKCQSLGMVRGAAPALGGGMPAAQIDVRNRTAKVGGNALVVISQQVTGAGDGEIFGDAYRCAF